jgi:hypothetical protein
MLNHWKSIGFEYRERKPATAELILKSIITTLIPLCLVAFGYYFVNIVNPAFSVNNPLFRFVVPNESYFIDLIVICILFGYAKFLHNYYKNQEESHQLFLFYEQEAIERAFEYYMTVTVLEDQGYHD